ncbi:TIGR03668 family PPOX class F420-dependent oxidoreductase [Nocardia sp. NPDC051030]|uniref:TIGR03668 family PPOX class F420-dependent oxidoreductase n=1 Tax=Nocardia sp. NPDC051030 TaxID=3155162 RepID=UPI003441EE14
MRLNERESLKRFRAARVARLATVSAAGEPHIAPVTFAVGPDPANPVVVIAIDHKPKTTMNLQRLRNIAATGRASILADVYDDDWTQLWWVRLDGSARVLTEETERAEPVTLLRTKYPQYQQDPPTGPVIRIDVESITGWSYSG